MQQVSTSQCDHLGIDYPIFGFAHDIATVAAITNAGVYGATRRFPDEIREELALIRSRVGEKPFGVDLVLLPRMPEHNSKEAIEADISEEHKSVVVGLIENYQVPPTSGRVCEPSLFALHRLRKHRFKQYWNRRSICSLAALARRQRHCDGQSTWKNNARVVACRYTGRTGLRRRYPHGPHRYSSSSAANC